jgi:hypothetical protein
MNGVSALDLERTLGYVPDLRVDPAALHDQGRKLSSFWMYQSGNPHPRAGATMRSMYTSVAGRGSIAGHI